MPWHYYLAYAVPAAVMAFIALVIREEILERRFYKALKSINIDWLFAESLIEQGRIPELTRLAQIAFDREVASLRQRAIKESCEFIEKHAPDDLVAYLQMFVGLSWSDSKDFPPTSVRYLVPKMFLSYVYRPGITVEPNHEVISLSNHRWQWAGDFRKLQPAQKILFH